MLKITSLKNKIKNYSTYYIHKLFLKSYITTSLYGVRYLINPNSSLDTIIQKEGTLHDWNILKKLDTILRDDSVIFDIGANVGHLSLLFAKKLAPNGSVFCYEPDQENREQLTKNKDLNALKNITILPYALQDNHEVAELEFNIRRSIDGDGNQNRGLSSLKKITKFTKDTLQVPASTIDNECRRLGVTHLDFIKIDVEGAEYMVLQGGRASLQKYKPIIQYEYSTVLDALMKEDNTTQSFTFLQGLGYRQFYEKESGTLTELKNPDPSMKDVNMVCFHQDKIPEDPSFT